MKIEEWLQLLEQRWEEFVKMENWSPSDQTMIFTVVSLILFILAVVWFLPHKRRARKRWKRMRQEAKSFFRDMKMRKKSPIVPVNVVLNEGEVGILQEPSMLYETRVYRLNDGGGKRIRGSYLDGGGSGSQQRLRHIDSGRIILTNRRLIFDGQWENRTTNIKDIKSARPLEDAVEVSFNRNRKNQIYAVRNSVIWAKTILMSVSGKMPVEPDEAAPLVFNRRDF